MERRGGLCDIKILLSTIRIKYAYNYRKEWHMKRRELIKLLEKNGWYIKRNGGNHDLYTDGNKVEPIPRHPDINERLARDIIKRQKLK